MKTKLLFVALLVTANAHASCGSSFCSVNTHWDTQGLVNDDALRVDLRYSYANANTLRSGSSKIAPAQPTGSDTEIENLRTINQMLNLDLDYSVDQKWNVALDLPLVMRDHTHTFDSSVSGPLVQQAKFTGLGDVRVLGKYKFDSAEHHAGSGMSIGIKLPTGAIDKTMTPSDPTNPNVPNPYPLDRSSQPGTGSTDLLLGTYYHRDTENSPWGWFASGQLQYAVITRDDYRPGNALNLDMGAHHAFAPTLTGLLQLNTQFKNRDTGLNANPASGGHSLSLSPGLSLVVAPKTNLYSFVQVALLQYANSDSAGAGQLTAPWSFAMGISHSY
jgi:hypothetical protein